MMQSRTHNCGELRAQHAGEHVKLVGWMENVREVGGSLAFVVLRDFYGTTQIVVETSELLTQIKGYNKESTISVEGTVRERASKNPNQPTGDIEVVPEKIELLGRCRYNSLPFEINRSREADETQRLKYRYLDLRNPAVKKNIILRCNVIAALRKAMMEHDFLEITTPILTASSPEGARDYLVPARKHPGKFYALPQAPQQFKQLLMTSGFDRYFQIAPCFRDEDARGDRSPGEFYQLDMEMAFASQEDVFAVCEDVLPPIFAKFGTYDIASQPPFRRIKYLDALEIYGSDKPDLRIDLTATNVSSLFEGSSFEVLADKTVKAVAISNCSLTRKQIDKLLTDCEVQAGAKGYWFKVDEKGDLAGGIAKFVDKEAASKLLPLEPNTLVLVAGGELATKLVGVMIKTFGPACEGHMDKERYEFCWIVDFPMYEIGDESGELEFCHNPFSMPAGGLDVLLKAERGEIDPLTITADQYDLVCNGVELSSGAVRNHDPEIMIKAFELVRLGEEDVKAKFPAMYNAFTYGAPPHAGIAPGVDRMVMLLSGEESIREVIADYMDEKGKDTMRLTLAEDGRACEGALERQTFDLILLDVMLPDIDGFTLCRTIRKKDMVPIVFLTAKGSEEDILWGYGLGCDDYIVKPFSLATLYAKILAILRRTKQENQKETITCGKIRMDKQSCQVFVKEREVQLQNKQYEILRFLMEHKNIVWSRDALLNHIWGYDYIGVDRVVDNQIKKLRNALGEEGKRIQTVVGRGYKISDA